MSGSKFGRIYLIRWNEAKLRDFSTGLVRKLTKEGVMIRSWTMKYSFLSEHV